MLKSHGPFFFLWNVCSCLLFIFSLGFCSLFLLYFQELFICEPFVCHTDCKHFSAVCQLSLTLFLVCSVSGFIFGKGGRKEAKAARASLAGFQPKKTAPITCVNIQESGARGHGDCCEPWWPQPSSYHWAHGIQQTRWAVLRERPGVRFLHGLGLYRGCEIPPELSRTWHLTLGEQSIPDPTQNRAWGKPVMGGERAGPGVRPEWDPCWLTPGHGVFPHL